SGPTRRRQSERAMGEVASVTRERAGEDEILARMRAAMAESGLDAVLPMSPENVAYASGVAIPSQRTVRSRLAGCVIPREGETDVVTVKLEAPLVESRSRLDHVTAYEEFVQDPVEAIAESLRERGAGSGRVGIETTYLSVRHHESLRRCLPDARLEPIDDMLTVLRLIKTAGEIEAIRRIGAVAERIASEACAGVRPGDTERRLGNIIAERYAAAGGDQLTMLVVGAGERSAHPNAPPTDRELRDGDVVRIDVIGTAGGYYSDVARTAVVGEPTPEQERIYGLLMDVHRRALVALRPGAASADVYRIYAEAMAEAGLPAYHFLGHGLGITLHEEPFVNTLTSTRLQEGMVLCIEPLTMLDGRFGMQIEDEVLITADGCEPFTRAGEMLRIGG
ncbi:MAG: M24 family metallopeptidase, partial [Candidatus Rokuibacteriota bacterium]